MLTSRINILKNQILNIPVFINAFFECRELTGKTLFRNERVFFAFPIRSGVFFFLPDGLAYRRAVILFFYSFLPGAVDSSA